MISEKHKVLVLNKGWTPIAATSARRALSIVIRGLGFILDKNYQPLDWVSWVEGHTVGGDVDVDERCFIRTGKGWIECPTVITLSRFGDMPKRKEQYSRRGIYGRDREQCQYCGTFPKGRDLTIDHVLPRSKGGKSAWENCVVCCQSCNTKKGNRLLEEIDMRLQRKPKRPEKYEAILGDNIRPEWTPFVGKK